MNKLPASSAGQQPLIGVVVVTYQPDAALLENLRRLVAEFKEVLVVDNGSTSTAAEIVDAAEKLSGVQVIRNGKNLGIAAALNVGIRLALNRGCVWIATFDQDTSIPENYLTSLLAARTACPASERVGMIVPGWAVPPQETFIPPQHPPADFIFMRMGITSGSLTLADVFLAAGFYDEAMFIDYVDAEFCLRLQKKGFLIISAPRTGIIHELGTAQTRNLLGWHLTFRIHTAWRYYYIMRNRLLVYRRYFASFPRWTLHDAKRLLLELGRIACLEKDRIPKLHCAALGIWDGLRGKSGRHPQFP